MKEYAGQEISFTTTPKQTVLGYRRIFEIVRLNIKSIYKYLRKFWVGILHCIIMLLTTEDIWDEWERNVYKTGKY